MSAVLRATDVSVQFGSEAHGVRALQDIHLQIQSGERVALVGANGCGKSTLLRVLHGLLQPTAGSYQADAASQHAMLFQRPHLLRMSVHNNVALGLWLHGTPWQQAKVRTLDALHAVGMADQAHRPARKLSGGQQQRVALARAWALSPQVLFLDEPTASLDPHAKRDVEALIGDMAGQHAAMTLVFASHNLGQVKRLATRVVYLEQGRILADLPVHDFFGGTLLQTDYPQAHLFVRGELV